MNIEKIDCAILDLRSECDSYAYELGCGEKEQCEKCHIQTALEALEKQIPKKPIGDLNSVPHYRCPACKKSVVLYENSARLPHCQWCGQAIDWSWEKL
jgi:ribosomal protein S27E